jgi:hypothetical protein
MKQTSSISLKSVLVAFSIALSLLLVTHLLKFPGSVAHLMDITNGQKTLDMQASVSTKETYDRLTAFGEIGRSSYKQTIVTIDIIFPISTFIFLFVLSKYSLQKFSFKRFFRNSVLSLSISYVAFDFLENLSILILLTHFPDRLEFLANNVGYLTLGKKISMTMAFFIPLALIIISKIKFFTEAYHYSNVSKGSQYFQD